MLDKIRKLLSDLRMSEIDAMNLLQDEGIVADECVHLDDVAAADHQAAFDRLLEKLLF